MTEQELVSSIAEQFIEAGYDQASFGLCAPLIASEIEAQTNKLLSEQEDITANDVV